MKNKELSLNETLESLGLSVIKETKNKRKLIDASGYTIGTFNDQAMKGNAASQIWKFLRKNGFIK